MTDPHRLLSNGATDFERLLLGSAARERPTDFQRRRMRRAIGLSQVGLMLLSAKALAGAASQTVVVAVIAASLAGGSSTPKSMRTTTGESSVTSSAPSTLDPNQVPQVLLPPAPPVTSEMSAGARTDPSERSVETDAPIAKPMNGARAASGTRKLPDLREEIALMDQARSALRNGAPSRAIVVLEQYRGRFPHGSFGQEATVLRIEALAASGNQAKAVSEANGFLSRNPNSPHTERLRRIIGTR